MKQSIFRAPLLAFYSKSFYADIANDGKGLGIAYLFVLLLLSCTLSTLGACIQFNKLIDSPGVDEIVRVLPDITVKQGRMSINKECPYRMSFHNAVTKEEKLIIFDTSGQTKDTDEASLLLDSEGVLLDGQEQKIPWSMICMGNDFDLPAAKFKDLCKSLSTWLLLAGVLQTPVAFILHLLLAQFYAGAALVMDRHKLGYKTALRMSITAMTPSIVLTTLFYVFACRPELWEILTVPITLGYLFFGYNSIQQKETVSQPSV